MAGYRKKVVFENLSKSFPEKSEAEILTLSKKFYHHLCDVIVETIKLRSISFKSIKKRFLITNSEILQKHPERNIVIYTSHNGNWEWGSSSSLHTDRPIGVIYQQIQNQNLDLLLKKNRARFGMQLILNKQAFSTILEQEKEHKAYIMIADLTPHKNKIALTLDFLGRPTPVHTGAEAIAHLTKSVCYYMQVKKVKRGYYELNLFEMDWDKAASPEEHPITHTYFKHLEADIREQPAYWLWSHRRWKYAPK